MHLKQIFIQFALPLCKLFFLFFLPFILPLFQYSYSSSLSLPLPPSPPPTSLFSSLPPTFKHSIPSYWFLMNHTIQVLQHNEMGQAMWRKRLEEMGSHLIAFHLLLLLIGLLILNSGMHLVLQVCYYYNCYVYCRSCN